MLHEMEVVRGGGGCCCAARAAFPQAHDLGPSSEVQKILLRFRPIAPRPVPPQAPGSGASSTKPPEECPGGSCVEKNGKKRSCRAVDVDGETSRPIRSTRTRRGPKPKNKKPQALSTAAEAATAPSSSITTSATSSDQWEVAPFVVPDMGPGGAVRAFPAVLPEMKELPIQLPTSTELRQVTAGWWDRPQVAAPGAMSHIVAPTPHRPVCSVVTVARSTAGAEWEIAGDDEQQRSAGWLSGSEEREAKRKLWTDARPALVSDSSGKVTWTNAAYRTMVGALDDEDKATAAAAGERAGVVNGGAVMALLVAPAAVLEKDVPAFSCRVKVRWCGAGRSGGGRPEKGSITAPCDVWRLAAGGTLVWRIDVGAALSLGPIGP